MTQSNHYKILGVLLTLYFAQGLPAGFITQALPAILRQYQVSVVAIGWSGLILVPWGIKFLWATVVDSHYHQKTGRSRSWILPLQILSAFILVGVAFFDPSQLSQNTSVMLLFAMLFCLSLIGATHDVATDALATRLLKTQNSLTNQNNLIKNHQNPNQQILNQQNQFRQSQGNAIQVIGYRFGLIIGGGVLMMSLDKIGWQNSFLAMAGLIILNTLPILYFQEPNFVQDKKPKQNHNVKINFYTIKHYIHQHYAYFWQDKQMIAWLGVLLTFKLADGISSGMVKPMMVDIGIGLDKIGFWVTILGSGASLLGAMVATLLLKIMPRFYALWGFNLLQALTTGLYGVVVYGFNHELLHSFAWVYAVNALEHFCASLALIAMLTTIMHYARHEQAGSDYTFQICLLSVISGLSHFLSGYMVDFFGYATHFIISMAVGLLALLPIIYWQKCVKQYS